jgi:Potential Queuosine, Q, salvage protein family
MTEVSNWYNDDDRYCLPEEDALGILTSTRAVVEQGEYVWINADQVEKLCEQWLEQDNHTQLASQLWDKKYHFHDDTERTVNWILLLDALNFCFWAEKSQPRWTIDYQGETLNGYWAEAAALTRAVQEGIPLWDAAYLSQIDRDTIAHIFRGNHTIPLLEQRVNNAQEVGQVLLERYDGQFAHAIEQASGSTIDLTLLLANNFSSFNDIATFRSNPLRFFKRAQICVADLSNAFAGQRWGAFRDLKQLTIFADYKLPQVLRHYHVLEYEPGLAEHIDNQMLLEAGSEEEVEIRANSIWAGEFLRQAMARHGHQITAAEIDQRLWLAGQKATEMRPYHRTRTIYY